MKIISIVESPRLTKRFRIYVDVDNGKNVKYYDFGLDGASTFLEHKDPIKRKNYWLRHLGNPKEYELITNLIPSASLFSAYLLWTSSNLRDNIDNLNKLLIEKYK